MKQRVQNFLAIAIILASTLALPLTANALDRATIRRYAENNILFYDPNGGYTYSGDINTCGNVNYAGEQVWADWELDAIQANRPFYEAAIKKQSTYIPWQLMAAIHSMEHSLQRDNPANGQGAYQLYSYTAGGTNDNAFYPEGEISDEEFARQTEIAVSVIAGKASGLDLSTDDGVKRLLFAYNGMAAKYIEKAKNMGYSDSEAGNGEGSAYVMNRYDAQRDPTSDGMSQYWPGLFVADGKYDETATQTRFGAFVKFKALTGDCSADCPGERTETYTSSLGKVYCGYKQGDSEWADYRADGSNTGTISKRGCFATATATIVSGFGKANSEGIRVNPKDMCYTGESEYASASSPYHICYTGSKDGFPISSKIGAYGLTLKASNTSEGASLSGDAMAGYLRDGYGIVIDEKTGGWTTSQHKIAIVDVRSANGGYEFYVLNPSNGPNGSRPNGWYSTSTITSEMKGYWVIGEK